MDVAGKLTAVLGRLREQLNGYDPETAHYLLDRWEAALGGDVAALATGVAGVSRRRGYQAASAAFARRWESRNGFVQLDNAMRRRSTVSIARWGGIAAAYGADVRMFVEARQMVGENDGLRQDATRRRSEARLRPRSALEQVIAHRMKMAEENTPQENPWLERHLVQRTSALLDLGEQIDAEIGAAVDERDALLARARVASLFSDTASVLRLPTIRQQTAMLRARLQEAEFQKRKAALADRLDRVEAELDHLRLVLEGGAR